MIKKEILYTLNTIARIQSVCNELQSHLLISDDLVKKLGSNPSYQIDRRGDYEILMKNEKVTLFEVSF